MIRVLIADDSDIRYLLARVLQVYGDIQVVGLAKDGVEAVNKALEFRPDVVIMDIRMPNMDGLKVYRQQQYSQESWGWGQDA